MSSTTPTTPTTSKASPPGMLVRPALGRVKEIGTFFDATTENFVGNNIFKDPTSIRTLWSPPSTKDASEGVVLETDCNNTSYSFISGNNAKEIRNSLDVSASLSLSVMAGQVNVSGSARYLQTKTSSSTEAKVSMVVSTRTKCRTFFGNQGATKNDLEEFAMSTQSNATHYVNEIIYGANVVISFSKQCASNGDALSVQGKLSIAVERMGNKISGEGAVDYGDSDKSVLENTSISVIGDIPFEDAPTSLEDVMTLIKDLPNKLKETNDGLGVPIQYTLAPVSSVYSDKEKDIALLDEDLCAQVMDVYYNGIDAVNKLKQLDKELAYLQNLTSLASDTQDVRTTLVQAEKDLAKLPNDIMIALKDPNSSDKLNAIVTGSFNPSAIQDKIDTCRLKNARVLFMFSDAFNLVDRIKLPATDLDPSVPLVSFAPRGVEWTLLGLQTDATYVLCLDPRSKANMDIISWWKSFKKMVEDRAKELVEAKTTKVTNTAVRFVIFPDDSSKDPAPPCVETLAPNVNDWIKVPASKVLSVETGTLVASASDHSNSTFVNKDAGFYRYCDFPVQFKSKFEFIPRVSIGTTALDAEHLFNTRFITSAHDVKKTGFTVRVLTWDDAKVFQVNVAWTAIGTNQDESQPEDQNVDLANAKTEPKK